MRRALLAAAAEAARAAGASRPTSCTCCRAGSTPASCELQRVDWNSPAQLLEQIIRHEAVHEIDGWDDLRRRLQPDRRCFAFFHPQLPDEPLIFVEVALLPEMPSAIAPLIDKTARRRCRPSSFKVAAFYSISNCQPGLRGVSLGNFLIKRVADELQARAAAAARPSARCRRSPASRAGCSAGAPSRRPAASARSRAPRRSARSAAGAACGGDLGALANAAALRALPERGARRRCCASRAVYLGASRRRRRATRWRASTSTTARGWSG